MKTLFTIFSVIIISFFKAQVLITTNSAMYNSPDPSAVLHVADNNKGILLPRISIANKNDISTIDTPTDGVTFYNTYDKKFNFWSGGSNWNKVYETEDAAALIDITKNFTGNSTAKTVINSFPSSMPSFTLESNTSGWTYLNASATITVTKSINTNLVSVEGMSQIDNTSTASSYQFAIGVFVDDKLKLVRKYYGYSTNASCLWKKFNLAGVFENLSVGNHVVKVYAYNLPKLSNDYSLIAYGGASSSSCNNLNEEMARIFITAQLAE